jgi:aspartate/tyrosine/aromatic aminotransferase
MSTKFGSQVVAKAEQLLAAGKDANQIANILFQQDGAGRNYGIGIILDGMGQPADTSPTLLAAAQAELALSGLGNYCNSGNVLTELKSQILEWQRIPEELAPHFKLALPSDAGTGAVQSALQAAHLLSPQLDTISFEKMSWPAYKTIAKVVGLNTQETPLGDAGSGPSVLPVYQPGPHNSTGRVPSNEEVQARAADGDDWVLLDRAYSGFEFAGDLAETSYDAVMRKSYESQIKPFIDAGRPFMMAISPTKAFVTFALRPCGILLAFCPDPSLGDKVQGAFNATIRSRGSSFEHPITRAFAGAMINHLPALEAEHAYALQRLAEAEASWRRLAQGTPLAAAFSSSYAGLFRNVPMQEGAAAELYDQHVYPVFSGGRCRLNVTGLPSDADAAAADVALFAKLCT